MLVGLIGLALAPDFARGDPVDDLLKQAMQQHQIAGLSLMIVKDGQPVKTQGYGLANLEWNMPVDSNTVFEIGSITKQFTAACVLLLAQDGKLSVDDPISRYLKNTPASWTNITVRHLLTHTSGLRNYTELGGFTLTQHLTQAQFIQKMGAHPLVSRPGDAWAYCNTGYNLLGYIIENVSGENYWSFLRERILSPLQMTATGNRDPRAVIPNRAAGYELTTNHVAVNRDYDLTDVFSAGSIVSTVVDLAKWDAALNGDKPLTAASKAQMWSPTKLNDGSIKQYGFGWYLDPLIGHRNIGHSGSTSGFSCSLQRFPDDGLSVILLCNAGESGIGTRLAKQVAGLYLIDKTAKK
jgi:CubicO group peptidase (beta-lactamase class C family)